MADYYMAEDGTLHDREAERHERHRPANTQSRTPAPQTDDAPQVSTLRKCVYRIFTLLFGLAGASCAYDSARADFTAPAHLDFIEDYVQQFIFDRAEMLVIVLTLFCLYLYGKYFAPKHKFNAVAFITAFVLCGTAPFAAVLILQAAPIITALVVAALVLLVLGVIALIFA